MTIQTDQFAQIIALAKENGLQDFGNACGACAVAIRRVLFPEGKLVCAANKPFWEESGVLIGHAAVEVDGLYFDADGEPKTWDDIEHWGFLDFEDKNLTDRALDLYVVWNEAAARQSVRIEPSEDQVLVAFGSRGLDRFVRILHQAKDKVLGDGAEATDSNP